MALIENVSDTARWVAVYRAMESARPDALFNDPFAERLAGNQGAEIVDRMKSGRAMAWAMIVRTTVMDEMILDRIRNGGIDTVLNLAAGLDTRAWRMPLPPTLQWFDVDLPAMTEYKASHMKGEAPVCRYEAIAADLTDEAVREDVLKRIDGVSRKMLVITEGLLIYLGADEVASLARALHALPSARWWISDLANSLLLEFVQKTWDQQLQKAPFRFAPDDSAGFFAPLGWKELVFRNSADEGRRLHREMKMMWLWRWVGRFMAKERQQRMKRMSGIVMFERT